MPERENVRLLLWSAACLPGVHLPFFAAVEDGLFAEHGLDVELVESAPGPERVRLLADGAGDLLLTATLYHQQALAEPSVLPVRAVGVLHQRSSLAAVVPETSDITSLADLAGCRLGAPVWGQMGWMAIELQAALREAGVGPTEVADMSYPDAFAALASGEIDLVANLADLLPIDRRRAGVALRAVPVGTDVYTSAVLASDSVPAEIVERFVAAASSSFDRQRGEPTRGVAALRARYPEVDADVASATWSALEPYAFAGGRAVAPMSHATWARTLRWNAQAHGLAIPAIDHVVRTDRLTEVAGARV
jgi:ABC-type nitrate/sulfonate/bicarbonate transport system substrate-binding protein